MSEHLAAALRCWLADGEAVARVLVATARGSTPREAGAAMLVTAQTTCGTIGGGTLEWDAIVRARLLLARDEAPLDMAVPLGPAIGQCCGGHVRLRIERAGAAMLPMIEAAEQAERARWPTVLMFGAGHVGRAIARALAPLPLRLHWIDGRAGEFGPAVPDGVEAIATDAWDTALAAAPSGSACLVLTHSHALDALITAAVLERGDFAYVGLIGSRSKRRQFERAFRDIGLAEDRIATLVCPIGARGVRDKRPAVIAAFVAAELVEVFASYKAGQNQTRASREQAA